MVEINRGEGLSDLVIAYMVGTVNKKLGALGTWTGAYSPKGLAATVAVNNRLGQDVAGLGRGSIVAPYATIQAAVSAMGKPSTKAGYEQPRELIVDGGIQDGTVKLPMGQWVITLLKGAVLTGKITFEMDDTLRFGSTKVPSLTVNGDESTAATVTSPAPCTIPLIDVTQAAVTPVTTSVVVNFRNVTHDAINTNSNITSALVDLQRTNPTVAMVNPAMVITALNITGFPLALSCLSLDMNGGLLVQPVTVVANSRTRNVEYSATPRLITGPAGTFWRVDGSSNFYIKVGPWTFAGGIAKQIISDNT